MNSGRRAGGIWPRWMGGWLLCCASAVAAAAGQNVGALGRLVPAGGLVEVAAPITGVLAELHVAPGERVEAGQLLAVLDVAAERAALLADAEQDAAAQAAVQAAQQRLQRTVVELEQLQLAAAEADLAGYKALDPGARNERELARRRQLAAEAAARVEVERARLEAGQREAELAAARAGARVREARAALGKARVVAPVAGSVLEIHRAVGEAVGGGPLLRLADLTRMLAECEVFVGDLVGLQPGQAAEVSHAATGLQVSGKVLSVSPVIDGRSSLGTAVVQLDDPALAARLVGLEVQVSIRRGD
ncbi:MAG TPA: HlyD family efflux transporter periplasmic adaptor subunit [Gammaproteobacteria bacterium]